MVNQDPKLQNMMAVDTYKNKAKACTSQICACSLSSVCPLIKKVTESDSLRCHCRKLHSTDRQNNRFASKQHKSLK